MSLLPIRPDLINRKPYGAPQVPNVVRLNTNENPFSHEDEFISEAIQLITAELRHANRYPDRDCVELRSELSIYLNQAHNVNLKKENVWPANGSNEILQQLFQLFGGPGRAALGFEPSYSMHPIIAATTHTNWKSFARDSRFAIDDASLSGEIAEASLVVICTPNNPTGTTTSLKQIENIYYQSSGVVIVDEAYIEFSNGPSAVQLVEDFPRLAVVRTMSKAFGFAGVRLGYLVASPEMIEAIQLVRLPYHLSALTQVTSIAALRYNSELRSNVEKLISERNNIAKAIKELGLVVTPSDANFILFGEFKDQSQIWHQLLERGVLVRDVGIPGWLRVTCGTEDENRKFLTALAEVVEQIQGKGN